MSHPVYPDGPDCDIACPGPEAEFHVTYAKGHKAGERYIADQVRAILPRPKAPKIPAWVEGPTRRRWAREGILHAVRTIGGRA